MWLLFLSLSQILSQIDLFYRIIKVQISGGLPTDYIVFTWIWPFLSVEYHCFAHRIKMQLAQQISKWEPRYIRHNPNPLIFTNPH